MRTSKLPRFDSRQYHNNDNSNLTTGNSLSTLQNCSNCGSHSSSLHKGRDMENYDRYDDDENIMFEEDGFPFKECAPFDAQKAGIIWSRHITRENISGLIHKIAIQYNRKFIDLKLLRIISPMNIAGSRCDFAYSNRNHNWNVGHQKDYIHPFLIQFYPPSEGSRLTHIMENRTQKCNLWNFNFNLGDNLYYWLEPYIASLLHTQ